jgi:hypothetical protein
MSVKFPITVTPPRGADRTKLDDLLSAAGRPDYAELEELITRNLQVAVAMWARCFHSNAEVAIEVTFDPTADRAGGSSKGNGEFGLSQRYSNKTVVMEGAAYEIAGLGTPSIAGISIALPINDYLTNGIWFDPDATRGSQEVPDGKRVDAVTLFLHEMAHALGFNGFLVQPKNTPADRWGPPAHNYVSRYDEQVERVGNHFFFAGPSATGENDGRMVPLSDHRKCNNDYHHIGNDAGPCPVGRSDLMTGYPWKTGFRYAISRLDLAILKDVGLPVV